MVKVKRKNIILLIVAAGMLILMGFGLDNRLKTTNYEVSDSRVPVAFEGFKIAQLSDMHCLWFGEMQSALLAEVKAGEPDIIVLTGDIIDVGLQDYDSVDALFEGLVKIAPVYAVNGNHEIFNKTIQEKMAALYTKNGITFLKDAGTKIGRDGAAISVYGYNDREELPKNVPEALSDTYSILLYHKSNQFDAFAEAGYGLVFSGHTHGGLIRLPFVGGIVTPDGEIDFAAKYSGGRYTVGSTTLIANRGMAGAHNVPRIFNRPEVVFVTLHHAE